MLMPTTETTACQLLSHPWALRFSPVIIKPVLRPIGMLGTLWALEIPLVLVTATGIGRQSGHLIKDKQTGNNIVNVHLLRKELESLIFNSFFSCNQLAGRAGLQPDLTRTSNYQFPPLRIS
jgi:hypothetical protein